MLRSTLGAFLPPLRSAHIASDSDSAFSCFHLKDLREEDPKNNLELRSSQSTVSSRSNNRGTAQSNNCSSSVMETVNTSAGIPSSSSSGFPPSFSLLTAPRSMWQEAIRRKRYLLDRTGETGEVDKGGGGREKRSRSPDWLYESYYCMSQQHPLIVFLLLIVMGACLALLTVFFASGLVSCSFTTYRNTHKHLILHINYLEMNTKMFFSPLLLLNIAFCISEFELSAVENLFLFINYKISSWTHILYQK